MLQKSYIGLTDPDWYRYLSAQSRVDEVNFWQPHGGRMFRVLQRGDPFFFKLRAPHKAIAGFGFFERYESLPAWLAWECFGAMNGAPDFDTMVDRIGRLRGDGAEADRSGQFKIGCIMIKAPFFFAPTHWVTPPVDWARTGIQQGKTYGLDAGEGLRILTECVDRATLGDHYWNVDRDAQLVAADAPRYGNVIPVRPRLGQGLFSLAVRDAYDHACAITGEHSDPVLEAAHIMPYGQGGQHRVDNGLLLRSDLHRLYDRGYVTVTPDLVFRVGERLGDEFKNGRTYYEKSGRRIRCPDAATLRPRRDLLEWHGRVVFRG